MQNLTKRLWGRVPSPARVLIVVIVVGGLVLAAGLSWHIGTELTAVITAVYATLVYYQLKEMETQRQQQRKDKEDEEKREFDRRPILRIGPFEPKAPFLRLAPEYAPHTGRLLGHGFYINIPLTNDGKTLARKCQPLLTAWGEREGEKGWKRDDNWVPVGLRWILDEPNVYAVGKPTEERDLVPKRPYLFNLGKISTLDPGNFELLLVVTPTAQSCRFSPGEYCFEVTGFSENAESVVKWYRIRWYGSFSTEEDIKHIHERLHVEELNQAAWTR